MATTGRREIASFPVTVVSVLSFWPGGVSQIAGAGCEAFSPHGPKARATSSVSFVPDNESTQVDL